METPPHQHVACLGLHHRYIRTPPNRPLRGPCCIQLLGNMAAADMWPRCPSSHCVCALGKRKSEGGEEGRERENGRASTRASQHMHAQMQRRMRQREHAKRDTGIVAGGVKARSKLSPALTACFDLRTGMYAHTQARGFVRPSACRGVELPHHTRASARPLLALALARQRSRRLTRCAY